MVWNINEKTKMQLSNPDGYFYLLFIKKSIFFFAFRKCAIAYSIGTILNLSMSITMLAYDKEDANLI